MDISAFQTVLVGAVFGGVIGTVPGVLADETPIGDYLDKKAGRPCTSFLAAIFLGACIGAGVGAAYEPTQNTPSTPQTQTVESAFPHP